MRIVFLLSLILCLAGGVWLLPGTAFYWPVRTHSAAPVLVHGLPSTLLGLTLLCMAALGAMLLTQAYKGHAHASRHWQLAYLATLATALTCLLAALLLATPAP